MAIHYLGDSVEAMCDSLKKIRPDIEHGADQQALLGLLPPGGARNAVDAALWDLEAGKLGRAVWDRPVWARNLLRPFTPLALKPSLKRWAR